MKKLIILADGRIIVASKIREIYYTSLYRNYTEAPSSYEIKAEFDNGGTETLFEVCPKGLGQALKELATFLVDDRVVFDLKGEEKNEQVQMESN